MTGEGDKRAVPARWKPTERFSDRVENYRRYRPGYPPAVIDLIRQMGHLDSGAPVADIGSGTGILTRLLLEAGWKVHAVEPNRPMRQAAETALSALPRFHSLDATAEATALPDHSMAAITAAQAFHWFDRDAARLEFLRILKPGGWVFLIWNERVEGSSFDLAYHAILSSLGQAFQDVRDRAADKNFKSFFLLGTYGEASFPNPQLMTWQVLRGRFLSSSYVPTEGDPRHATLLTNLERAFHAHETGGKIVVHQKTNLYWGQLSKALSA